MERFLLNVAAVFFVLVVTACAIPDQPTDSSLPLTKDITLRGGEDGGIRVNGADLKPGDCKALMAYVGARDDDYDIHKRPETLGEMYDRGICVPHDPAKAYEAFKEAGALRNRDWHPVTAWKLWHGHGVERDREEAKRQFHAFFASQIYTFGKYARRDLLGSLKERYAPGVVESGFTWLKTRYNTKQKIVLWAERLYRGAATRFDGAPYPQDKKTARRILEHYALPYGFFHLGEVLFNEAISQDERDYAEIKITQSAHCGYLPAVLWLIEYRSDHTDPSEYRQSDAYKWALVAKALGADMEEILSHQEQTYSLSALKDGKQYAEWEFGIIDACR